MKLVQGKLKSVRVQKTRDPASLLPPKHESYFFHYELLIDEQTIKMVFHDHPQVFKSGQELCLAVFETVLGKEAFAYKNLVTDQVVHTGFILAELFWGLACLAAAGWLALTSFARDTDWIFGVTKLTLAGILLLGAKHYLVRGSRTCRAFFALNSFTRLND